MSLARYLRTVPIRPVLPSSKLKSLTLSKGRAVNGAAFVKHVRCLHASRPLGEIYTQNLPELGDSITSGAINEWVVNVGEHVEVDQLIAVVDTDKVSVEILAPVAGVLTKQYVNEPGAEIMVKAPLADFDTSATASSAAAPTPAGDSEVETTTTPAVASSQSEQTTTHSGDNHGGRTPLIQFRHGKRDTSSAPSPAVSSEISSSPTPVTTGTIATESREGVIDFMDLPPMYGRLPPMTEKEMDSVLLGGAE
mmetsp:Transcript_14190/g.16157  ORF Transcript_14190/g.16157 Transcript_14190/m.16157 type:complete len:251 (-) Transcript_14190:101-853(-)